MDSSQTVKYIFTHRYMDEGEIYPYLLKKKKIDVYFPENTLRPIKYQNLTTDL